RGRLSRAVGAEITDELALLDLERDPVDRAGGDHLPGKERPQAAERAIEPLRAVEVLDEVVDGDDGHALAPEQQVTARGRVRHAEPGEASPHDAHSALRPGALAIAATRDHSLRSA